MSLARRARIVQRARRSARVLAISAACCATPQLAFAAQVQAYVLFELGGSSSATAAAEKLRSTSLSNCLQLIIGSHARDVFVHIACDERDDRSTSFLTQAVMDLSRADGVSRATILSLKRGTN
jgi:hypothetical protein